MKLTKELEKQSRLLAEYIIDSEESDYENYCEENDLNPEDYLNNSTEIGPHIYAVAKAFLWTLDNEADKQFFNELSTKD